MIKGFLALAVATLFGFSAQADLGKYAGSYSGKFSGTKGTLIVGVSGNMLTAKFVAQDSGSGDILGDCSSRIGQMMDIDMDDNEIDHATFSFDAGSCSDRILGREMTLDFKHKNGMPVSATASVYSHTTTSWETVCTGGEASGGVHCQHVPRTDDWYVTGKFKK